MTEFEYPLLSQINFPSDLRKLPEASLPALCGELRRYILEVLSRHPGHLASSLGAVELTVALHYVFDTPYDRLVWDVGHQAYGHKVLTGRKMQFPTLRQWGGLAGFPSTGESEYDTFTAGHASNSISAALGMAVAAKKRNEDRKVVAIIGDGSMTGGLAFEGLNNASSFPNNLLIVLNDNNMSIDRNVGGLNKYMVDILTSKTYNTLRYDLYKTMRRMNLISENKRKGLLRFNNSFKALLSSQPNLFEGFSIRYFGQVDGNDVLRTVQILRDIKDMEGPKILHLKTQKGKGYAPAEAEATVWHAPGKFDIGTGIRETKEDSLPIPPLYQDVFGQTLVEFAQQDDRIVGVTPAMPTGCSLSYMQASFPDRTYDVGIAEGHAVTFSAGLSREGLIPFCNIYSSFMQRAYDQLIHDVAISKQHVVFCLDRAGLVGEDGATHQGAFDLAYLSTIPNMTVASPINEHQLRDLMLTAYKGQSGPMAIRYPRGRGVLLDWQNKPKILPIGRGCEMCSGKDVAVLTIGPIGNSVERVVARLRAAGIEAAWYNMIYAKPVDTELIARVAASYPFVVTVEEGTLCGGLGATVATQLFTMSKIPKLKMLGLPDEFIEHGSPDEQREYCSLDEDSIYNSIIEFIQP